MTNTSKTFANAKSALVVRPKSVNEMAFIYRNFSDLKNLVKFVGSKPSIDEEGNLYFRKQMIADNSVIFRNSYGQVTDVLPLEKAEEKYEIVADSEFKPEHANTIQEKPVRVAGDKTGMTRKELKEALTKAKVEYKTGLTRAQLQTIYDENIKKQNIKKLNQSISIRDTLFQNLLKKTVNRMRLTFYIIIKGRRKLRFTNASELDKYVKEHKLSSSAVIIMSDENSNQVGALKVSKYLLLEQSKL